MTPLIRLATREIVLLPEWGYSWRGAELSPSTVSGCNSRYLHKDVLDISESKGIQFISRLNSTGGYMKSCTLQEPPESRNRFIHW